MYSHSLYCGPQAAIDEPFDVRNTVLRGPCPRRAGNELSDNLGGAVSLSHQKGVERVEGSNVPLILINAGKSDWRDKNSRRTKIRLGPEAV